MRAQEFVTEIKSLRDIARYSTAARQDPEYRYYAGRNPLGDPVPMDDPAVGDIPDEQALAQLERGITQDQLRAALKSGMSTLTPKEREVLHMRFFQDLTLQQVADYLGVVRSRVQQIEAKALRKMLHPSRSDILRPFVNTEPSRQQTVPPAQAPTVPNLDTTQIAKDSPEWASYMAGYRLGQRAATPIAYEPDSRKGTRPVYPRLDPEGEANKAEDYWAFMGGYRSGLRKPLGTKK